MKYILLAIFLIIPFVMVDAFAEPTLKNEEFSIEVFVDELSFPTTMGFVEDGIIILEKNSGQVRFIQNGVLQESPLLDFNVDGMPSGETGLVGILVDNKQVFIYVTESIEDGGEQIANRIYKYVWNGNSLIDQKMIHQFPPSPGASHVGGVMIKNFEDEIFIVIGDMASSNYDLDGPTQNSQKAPLRDTGIILKVVKDGSVLKPIETDSPTEYYHAIGIRNSFGLDVDPITGKLWDSENGAWEFDEINLVEKRFNSGWEKFMGIPTLEQKESLPQFEDFEYSDPEFVWQKTVAPTALKFLNSDKFLDHKNNLLVGDCQNGNIYEFKLNEERNGFIFESEGLQDNVLNNSDSMKEIIFGTGFGCITDLELGPDGMLYVVSIFPEGKIFRIVPSSSYEKSDSKLKPFADFTFKNLNSENFVNKDLRFADFSGSDISNANFSGANMLNVKFNETISENVDFSNSNLKHAIFNNANLRNSNFEKSDLLGTYFANSDLNNTNFNESNMKSSNFTHVNFVKADLSYADFKDSDLSYADFSGANLKDAILSHADLSYADFSGANLEGLYYYNSDITGAIIDHETKVDGCFGQDFWNRGLSMIFRNFIENEDFISKTIKNIIPQFCI